jgi:hypothetical protein
MNANTKCKERRFTTALKNLRDDELQFYEKVREDGTPSPASETGALPRETAPDSRENLATAREMCDLAL